MLRCALIVPFLLCKGSTIAQSDEHPFVESFSLSVLEGRIQVQWVMKGGSTCDGSVVERSTDGVGFEAVHRIEGLCGDPDVAVPFNWADADPPELSLVHYRIEFGAEGRSSIKSVRFDQLTRSDQRFFPSPASGEATLLLNVPASALVDLDIFDAGGRVVLANRALVGRKHALDLHRLPAGSYTYVVVADGRRFSGRFARE
ncbi:MAG: T9SS type A sorting domain-containing protein [Flavobacteriales bacterium]|nr:T9SS type A sorting domain-containing protein [Flavobacteriales bacterium]